MEQHQHVGVEGHAHHAHEHDEVHHQHHHHELAHQHQHQHQHHHQHQHQHQHAQHQMLPQHLQQLAHDDAIQQALPVAPTEYTVGGDEEQVQGQYLLHKRLMDDVLAQSSGILGVPLASDIVGGQDKKRRKTTTEQQVKRHRYDVLKAFFRVYFCESKDAMVLKDAIFNLYTKKIPANQRIARNAMYRHMWSFFKNRISAFQSNYREYIKGIKLSTGSALNYDGCEKDLDLLHTIGVGGVFDFDEEELEKSDRAIANVSSPFLSGDAETAGATTTSGGLDASRDATLIGAIEQLENQVKLIANGLAELRSRLHKKREQASEVEQAQT